MKGLSSIYFTFTYRAFLLSLFIAWLLPLQHIKADTYFSIGYATVDANELVYGQPPTYPRTDYKLSHLIWSAKNVRMFTAGTDILFNNGIVLNIEGTFSMNGGDGVMDDFDWIDTTSLDWSDWSNHPDTSITDAKIFDINAELVRLGNHQTDFTVFAGLKYEQWLWEARGGSYIYSNTNTTDRSITGNFTAGQAVITYEQKFTTPYLGFKLSTKSDDWIYKFEYQFSNLVDVATLDNHILRSFFISNNYETGKMRAYKLDIGYQLAQNFNLNLSYDIVDYAEVRGGSNYSGSETGFCTNCAGNDFKSKTLSLGAEFIF